MKKIKVNNISKADNCIIGEPVEPIPDRTICVIMKKFFTGDEVKSVGCIYVDGKFKLYNKHVIEQEFSCDYFEATIVN